MDIFTLIGILISLAGLIIAIKVYLHSHRNIKFDIDSECIEKIRYRINKDQFSGLINIPLIFVNQGAKRIIIEKLVIEKAINPINLPKTNVNLTQNFFVIYHFFVSEETLLNKQEILYEDSTFGTRKYNILKQNIVLEASDKYIYNFSIEDYFRHIFYYFDDKICTFIINNIYAVDTLGNKYKIDKKDIELLKKSTATDSDAINVILNNFDTDNKIKNLFIYHLDKFYNKKIHLEHSSSAMAFVRYLKIKEEDEEKDLDEHFQNEMLPDNSILAKDEVSINKSFKLPIVRESIIKELDNLTNINEVRNYLINKTKMVKKIIEEAYKSQNI